MSRPNSGRLSLVVVALLGLGAMVRAWLMGPMWLDRAYLSLSYSDRIARGYGPFLPGQEVPIEGFSNPLWVAFFGLVGRLNIREADVQMPLSMLAYVGLAVLVFHVVRQRASLPVATLSAALLGLTPVAASVRDGTDAVCLALLSLWAARAVSIDMGADTDSRASTTSLALLAAAGSFGVLVALGLAGRSASLGRWRNLKTVCAVFALLTMARWLLFGTWLPPLWLEAGPSLESFLWMPAWCLFVVLGVVVSRGHDRFIYGWIVAVGWSMASLVGQEEAGFGVALVPAVGAMAVFFGRAWMSLPSKWMGLLVVALLLTVDLRRAEAALEGVRTDRLSNFLQGRGMGRFLLWRFESEDRVVVHRPGVLGYYSRRPLIDLSGRIHSSRPSPQQALAQEPVAVLPDRSIVSHKAQRVLMGSDWPEELEARYKQYAIQHQKAWNMVDVDPVWFHLYIRKDLPMLRPEIPASNGNILPRSDPFGAP